MRRRKERSQVALGKKDRAFLEQLYVQYHRLMFSTVYKVCPDQDLAEETVSDTLITLAEKLPLLRALPEKQRSAYLIVSVRNAARNRLAARNRIWNREVFTRELPQDFPAAYGDPEEETLLQERLALTEKMIGILPMQEREALRLKYREALSEGEISVRLDVSESTVRSYIAKARKHLKNMIEQEHKEGNLQ